jgi:hypothetical protein
LATAAQSWNELMKTDLAKQKLGPLAAAAVTVPACK